VHRCFMPSTDVPDRAGTPHNHSSHEGSGGVHLDQEFWEERYRSHPAVWSGHPNLHLVTQSADLTPGTALDVGAGEGADALWLAERGWHVTGIDISTVALNRAASHAREAGADVAGRIEWLQADLTSWVPKPMSYDLVSAQFLHLPKSHREPVLANLAASVAADGTLLIVGHHPSDMETTVPRPPMPELFYTAKEIGDSLNPDEWDILVCEAHPREVTDPEGKAVTIHDAVLRAQRSTGRG
jgi:SAM-dependent methyltransferase